MSDCKPADEPKPPGNFVENFRKLSPEAQQELLKPLARMLDAKVRKGPETGVLNAAQLAGIIAVVGSGVLLWGAILLGLAVRLARWSAGV